MQTDQSVLGRSVRNTTYSVRNTTYSVRNTTYSVRNTTYSVRNILGLSYCALLFKYT